MLLCLILANWRMKPFFKLSSHELPAAFRMSVKELLHFSNGNADSFSAWKVVQLCITCEIYIAIHENTICIGLITKKYFGKDSAVAILLCCSTLFPQDCLCLYKQEVEHFAWVQIKLTSMTVYSLQDVAILLVGRLPLFWMILVL